MIGDNERVGRYVPFVRTIVLPCAEILPLLTTPPPNPKVTPTATCKVPFRSLGYVKITILLMNKQASKKKKKKKKLWIQSETNI